MFLAIVLVMTITICHQIIGNGNTFPLPCGLGDKYNACHHMISNDNVFGYLVVWRWKHILHYQFFWQWMYDFVATRLSNKNMLPLSNKLVIENIFRDKYFCCQTIWWWKYTFVTQQLVTKILLSAKGWWQQHFCCRLVLPIYGDENYFPSPCVHKADWQGKKNVASKWIHD